MIRVLVRSDPGWRQRGLILWWGLVMGVMLSLIRSLEGGPPPLTLTGRQGLFMLYQFMAWWAVTGGMLAGSQWIRATRLHMVLPVDARHLWWVRLSTLLGLSWGTLLVTALVLTVWSHGPADMVPMGRGLWAGTARLAAFGLLLLGLVLTPNPTSRRIRVHAGSVTLYALVWLFLFVLLVALPFHPLTSVGALVGGILTLAASYRRTPRTYLLEHESEELSPGSGEILTFPAGDVTDPEEGTTSRSDDGALADHRAEERTGRQLLFVTVWRLLHNHWETWLVLPVVLFFTALMVWAFHRGEDISILSVYVLTAIGWTIVNSLQRLHPLDHLPLSRRLLFRYAAAPGITVILAGLAVGYLCSGILGPVKPAQIRMEEEQVAVPREFWSLTHERTAPEAVAPWGETWRPQVHRVLPVGSLGIYNPYEIGPESSPRFVLWQMRRAAAVMYGDQETDPPGYVPEEPGPAFLAGLSRGEFYPDEMRGRASPLRDRVYALLLFFSVLTGSVLLMLYLGGFEAGADLRHRQWMTLMGVLPLAVSWAIICVAMLSVPEGASRVLGPVMILLLQLSERLPVPSILLWAGLVAVTLLGLWLAERRFVRSEVPLDRVHRHPASDV